MQGENRRSVGVFARAVGFLSIFTVAGTALTLTPDAPTQGAAANSASNVNPAANASRRAAPPIAEGGVAGSFVPCPTNAFVEVEPDCGDYLDPDLVPEDTVNGGCNSVPPIFSPISCGQTVCGTSAIHLSRDTDWYEIVTTQPQTFTWAATASFEFVIGYAPATPVGSGICDPFNDLDPFAIGIAGDAISITTECLPPGTHWFFIAPSFSAPSVPCGSPYQAKLTCLSCFGACSTSDNNCYVANPTPGCNNPACCEIVCACDSYCCNVEWDAFCAGGGISGNCGAALLCTEPACGNPLAGDCFVAEGTPGCDDASCCETVCACDPFCCDVAWDGLCASGGSCSAANLCTPCISGTGEECDDPIVVSDGEFSGTIVGNTGTVDDTSCTDGDLVDEWYCYTASCTGTATASTCHPGTNYDSALAVFDGCSGNELVCEDDTFEEPCLLNGNFRKTRVSWQTVAGQRYLIRVSGFGGIVGDFELSISEEGHALTYSSFVNVALPDANAGGVADFMLVTDAFPINKVEVGLNINHSWVGDLCVTLRHEDTGVSVVLLQRMGDGLNDCHSGSPFGCGADNMIVILRDDAFAPIENQCVDNLFGSFIPTQPLSAFNGLNAASEWRLTVSDNAGDDLGTFVSWDLFISGVPCEAGCPSDCANSATFAPPSDGVVDGADLAVALGSWGLCPGCCSDTVTSATFAPPPDGFVDGADLAVLLGAWGDPPCDE